MQFVFKILNKLQINVIILKFSQALHIVHVWLHVDSVGFKKLYIENKTTVCLHDIIIQRKRIRATFCEKIFSLPVRA